jgi:hypothetical protein
MLPISLCLYLALGFLLESCLVLGRSLRNIITIALWVSCFGASFVSFLIPEAIGNFRLELVIMGAMFIFFYMIIFGKRILPSITELYLALFNTVFIFEYFFNIHGELSQNGIDDNIFLYVTGLISLIVFIKAITTVKVPLFLKLLFYIWYQIMACILLIYLLFHVSFVSNSSTLVAVVTVISIGGVIFHLAINLMAIGYLAPIPMKGESFSSRIERIKKHIQLLTSKYLDEDVNVLQNLLIILLLILLLLLNVRYFHINVIFILNAILIINALLANNISPAKDSNLSHGSNQEALAFVSSFFEYSISILDDAKLKNKLQENRKNNEQADFQIELSNLNDAPFVHEIFEEQPSPHIWQYPLGGKTKSIIGGTHSETMIDNYKISKAFTEDYFLTENRERYPTFPECSSGYLSSYQQLYALPMNKILVPYKCILIKK